MTYALREARDLVAYALAAPIAPIIALTALTALGLSGCPVHEAVHASRLRTLSPITVRNFADCVHPRWDDPARHFMNCSMRAESGAVPRS